MNHSRKNNKNESYEEQLDFRDTFLHAIPIMEKEVKDFFVQHFTKIDGNDFWQKCYSELPYRN